MAKTFKDKMQRAVNPTLQFISQPEEETPADPQPVEKKPSSQPESIRQTRRAQPQYGEETRSRRLQLLLTPSLYEAVREKAVKEHMSVNEMVNAILNDATRKRG